MALPNGYTQLEYIESSGTQYIDTGFKPNQDTRVVMDVNVQTPASATLGLFGVRDTSSGTAPLMFVLWTTGTGSKVRSDYFGTNVSGSNSIIGTRIQLDKNKNVYTDTVGNSLTNTAATGQCTQNMFLFGVNNAGAARYFEAMKLYSCQIYDNDTLVRNFIPCRSDAGAVGLYDIVNSKFYANKGTENFTEGPVSDPMSPHDGHNTNISSVAREIDSGTVLIGGVVREIESGTVLIGGVAREIEFAKPVTVYTLTITQGSSENINAQNIEVNGTKYNSKTTLYIEEGTTVIFRGRAAVVWDNKPVGKQTSNGQYSYYEYTHTMSGNLTASFNSTFLIVTTG